MKNLAEWIMLAGLIGLLLILSEQWTTQMIHYKLYELKDATAPIWRIG